MPLVSNSLGGRHTHTHTHTYRRLHQSDFKKPGVPACGRHTPGLKMERLRVKFDIAHFITKKNIAFTKYGKFCELEARHGVKIGLSYLTNNEVAKAKFFSIFMDGSTDKGNVDNELMMVCWCDTNAEDEKLHTRIGY